jgi:hypothetical protein
MKTTNICVNAALRLLEEVGIRDVQLAHGAKHPQLRFRINDANVLHVFAVCGTPSDWRSPENTRRDLRKYLREHGVAVAEPTKTSTPPPPRKLDLVSELAKRVAKLERQARELQEDRGRDSIRA